MSSGLFPASPDETRIEILKATYAALREHGYADLTIDRIGQHFPKSTSLIYHHYEGKDELLLDFLSYLLEDAEGEFETEPEIGPYERLQSIFEHIFAEETAPERLAFQRAMVEMRAQATTDAEYRRHFTEYDRVFRDHLADIVRDGIDKGVFRAVDPVQVATMLHTLLSGAMAGEVTAEVDLSTMRAEVEAYVEARLLADGQ